MRRARRLLDGGGMRLEFSLITGFVALSIAVVAVGCGRGSSSAISDGADNDSAASGAGTTCQVAGGECLSPNPPGDKGQGPTSCGDLSSQNGGYIEDDSHSCDQGFCCLPLLAAAPEDAGISYVATSCHDSVSTDADATTAGGNGAITGAQPAECSETGNSASFTTRSDLTAALSGAWAHCDTADAVRFPGAPSAVGFVVGAWTDHPGQGETDAPISVLTETAACGLQITSVSNEEGFTWEGSLTVIESGDGISAEITFDGPDFSETTGADITISLSPHKLSIKGYGEFAPVQ